MRDSAGAGVAVVLVLAALGVAPASRAQWVHAGEPLTLVVGDHHASGDLSGTAMDRVDARRTNAARSPLPRSALRIVWTRPTRPTRSPPLVTRDANVLTLVVLGADGEMDFIHEDGTNDGHVQVGQGPTSPPVVLVDGTVAAVTSAWDVIGVRVRSHEVAWRSHLVDPGVAVNVEQGYAYGRHGRQRVRRTSVDSMAGPSMPTWTLALEDGGLVVTIDRQLFLVDAEGSVRSRATVPASPASYPLGISRGAGSGSVLLVSEPGEVYEWNLTSATDAVRSRGSFGGPLEGSAVAVDARHVAAVVRGAHVVSLDLVTGLAETRGSSPTMGFTGTLALVPGALGSLLLQEVTLTGTHVVALQPDGRATPLALSSFSVPLTTLGAASLGFADAGVWGGGQAGGGGWGGGGTVTGPTTPTGTQLLVDASGTAAYATIDGHVGIVTPTSKHELGSLPCGAPPAASNNCGGQYVRPSLGFLGLVPAGPGAFIVGCENGMVSMVKGALEPDAP